MSVPQAYLTGQPNNIASGFLQSFVGAHQAIQQQQDQEAKDQQNKTLNLLMQMEPNVSPEYRDHIHSLIVQMLDLPSGKKGQAQLHNILGGLRQLSEGQGSDVQKTTTNFDPTTVVTDQNTGVNTAPPQPISLGQFGGNGSPLDAGGGVPLNAAGGISPNLQPPSIPLSALGTLGQQPATQPQTTLQTPQQGFWEGDNPETAPGRSPLVGGTTAAAVGSTKPLFNTEQQPGFTATSAIPLMADPLEQEIRRRKALAPILAGEEEDKQQAILDRQTEFLKQKAASDAERDKQRNKYAIDLAGLKDTLHNRDKVNQMAYQIQQYTPQAAGESDEDYNKRIGQMAGARLKQTQDRLDEMHDAHTKLYNQQVDASKLRLEQNDRRLNDYEKNVNDLIAKRGQNAQTKAAQENIQYLKARKDTVKTMFEALQKEEAKLKPDQDGYEQSLAAFQTKQKDFEDQMRGLDDDIQRVAQGGYAQGGKPGNRPANTPGKGKYSVGDVINGTDGKQYKVTGINPQTGNPIVVPNG